MNRYLILALFVCVASAFVGSASQLTLIEADDVETAGLNAESRLFFEDFCLRLRNGVKGFLGMREDSARFIHLFLETVAEISSASGDTNKNSLRVSGQDFWESVRAFAATGNGKDQLPAIFVGLKKKLIKEKLQQNAFAFCSYVEAAEYDLNNRLHQYEVAKQKGKETKKFLKLRLFELGCVSAGRISKVAITCRMIKTNAPYVFELSG